MYYTSTYINKTKSWAERLKQSGNGAKSSQAELDGGGWGGGEKNTVPLTVHFTMTSLQAFCDQ